MLYCAVALALYVGTPIPQARNRNNASLHTPSYAARSVSCSLYLVPLQQDEINVTFTFSPASSLIPPSFRFLLSPSRSLVLSSSQRLMERKILCSVMRPCVRYKTLESYALLHSSSARQGSHHHHAIEPPDRKGPSFSERQMCVAAYDPAVLPLCINAAHGGHSYYKWSRMKDFGRHQEPKHDVRCTAALARFGSFSRCTVPVLWPLNALDRFAFSQREH